MRIINDHGIRGGEPEIAVNPTDPNNIVYYVMTMKYTYKNQKAQRWGEKSFIDCYLAVSHDRGKKWTAVPNPLMTGRVTLCGDPMVAFGPDGTLYAAADAMGYDPARKDSPEVLGEITIVRSSDGGNSWTSPVITGTPIDRPWLSVDQSEGTLYITSSCASPERSFCEPNVRYIVSSHDKGATWTPRVRIDSPEYPAGRGGSISAAHGLLAVSYVAQKVEGSQCPCLVFATTRDTGKTWSRQIVPGATGIGGQAQIAADPSKAGQYTISALAGDRVRFLVFSTGDGGRTWSGPTAVTNNEQRVLFKPWINYSPEGVFGIVWRSSQASPDAWPAPTPGVPPAAGAAPPKTFPYDVWAAISKDGGKTFSKPLRVSSKVSPAPDPTQQATDDVSFIVLDKTDAHYGWGDWRSGEMQGWYGRTPLRDFKQ